MRQSSDHPELVLEHDIEFTLLNHHILVQQSTLGTDDSHHECCVLLVNIGQY